VNVLVVGVSVYNYNQAVTKPLGNLAVAPKDFNVSTNGFSLDAGIVSVSLKIGVRGNAFVGYAADVDRGHAHLDLKASVQSSVYAQASGSLFGVSVGLRVTMTFLNVDTFASGALTIGFDQNHGPYIEVHAAEMLNLAALSGKFEVVVNPWGLHDFTISLWDWSGFSWSGYLFLIDLPRFYLDPGWTPPPHHRITPLDPSGRFPRLGGP
jgi:hypothetical protein